MPISRLPRGALARLGYGVTIAAALVGTQARADLAGPVQAAPACDEIAFYNQAVS